MEFGNVFVNVLLMSLFNIFLNYLLHVSFEKCLTTAEAFNWTLIFYCISLVGFALYSHFLLGSGYISVQMLFYIMMMFIAYLLHYHLFVQEKIERKNLFSFFVSSILMVIFLTIIW